MSLKEGDVEFVVYAAKGRVVAIATSRSMIGSREPNRDRVIGAKSRRRPAPAHVAVHNRVDHTV